MEGGNGSGGPGLTVTRHVASECGELENRLPCSFESDYYDDDDECIARRIPNYNCMQAVQRRVRNAMDTV